MYQKFNVTDLNLTKYLFFTGKGGVGKTSTACATAVYLADKGKKVMLISTDPASNLQDVFETELDNKGVQIKEVPNLTVANFDPEAVAEEYKESVIAPFRGKLPDAAIENMEEQLSGSCTVEIAAFNEFSTYITDQKAATEFDYIIFDTAPTGHTLRMLQLPSAWSNFINENTSGASCLGQLSGLEAKKDIYKMAVETLADGQKTTLILLSHASETPLKEAERASIELKEIGIKNQIMIINALLENPDDNLSNEIFNKQQKALNNIPENLKDIKTLTIPLRPFNITGVKNVRAFLNGETIETRPEKLNIEHIPTLNEIIKDLLETNKKVIFTMGKGGVGKTTVAAAIALGLAEKGKKVHLTTTDPAAHLKLVISDDMGIQISNIDEKKETEKYKEEVLSKARQTSSSDDVAYIEESLRSPCTQEIAVFRAFADIVDKSEHDIIVIDTAPTGHTLLLLSSTEKYDNEIKKSHGEVSESVKKLLPKLKDGTETEVIIVTLAETTPVFEASRLQADLQRAGIHAKWWVINSSFHATGTVNSILKIKAENEIQWINKVNEISGGNFAVIPWTPEDLKNNTLKKLLS